jgi:hypothetical protein
MSTIRNIILHFDVLDLLKKKKKEKGKLRKIEYISVQYPFIADPSGNALFIKIFEKRDRIFS